MFSRVIQARVVSVLNPARYIHYFWQTKCDSDISILGVFKKFLIAVCMTYFQTSLFLGYSRVAIGGELEPASTEEDQLVIRYSERLFEIDKATNKPKVHEPTYLVKAKVSEVYHPIFSSPSFLGDTATAVFVIESGNTKPFFGKKEKVIFKFDSYGSLTHSLTKGASFVFHFTKNGKFIDLFPAEPAQEGIDTNTQKIESHMEWSEKPFCRCKFTNRCFKRCRAHLRR